MKISLSFVLALKNPAPAPSTGLFGQAAPAPAAGGGLFGAPGKKMLQSEPLICQLGI